MKIYSCNEKKMKWYRKVDWFKTLLIFIVVFVAFFSFFHFFIGGVGMLSTAITTAFKISFFITLGVIISYCIIPSFLFLYSFYFRNGLSGEFFIYP